MDIEAFDAAPAAQAEDLLRACAAVDAWVEALVAARPYGDVETLLTTADELAAAWTGDDVEQALADHPRIGERHAGAGASAEMSGREQSGVDTAGDVAARLAAGNARYEERFGRIFLVRAAGRTSEEILEQLEQRLDHDPQTELAVTTDQLRQIAALRLKGLFA